jgi:hypothetical protein
MRGGTRWLVAGGLVLGLTSAQLASQIQTPPQFRAGVQLVPVEVRAVDRDGNPVAGLTAGDFAIRDGGVAQEIAHFRPVSVVSDADAAPRTFLIVLGRGRLNQPIKALQALIDFVGTKALPQDRTRRICAPCSSISRPTARRERN